MNIFICDDQIEYINQIKSLIEKNVPSEFPFNLYTFNSGESFITFLKNNDIAIDLVFMDIEMHDLTGIETVTYLKKHYPQSIVFFITSHTQYISEIFRLNAFQFIEKPVKDSDFIIDLNRAIEFYKNNHKKILITNSDEQIVIEYSSIKYIEVNQKKVCIITKNDKITHYGRLQNYIDELSPYGFVMVHKSYLINLQHIKRVNKDSIELVGVKDYIPLSRSYKKEFMTKFKKFSLEMCL